MRTIYSLILFSLLLTSCASTSQNKEMSMETKVQLTTTPDLSKPMMAHLLLEIIKNSDIPNEEKLKILDSIKIFITELAYVRTQKTRSHVAYLKTINDENDKSNKEIYALARQLSVKEMEIQLDFLKFIKTNLKGKGDSEINQDIIDALTNQAQGIQTNQEMNQI